MNHSVQERYWRELDQLKVHCIYLELYLEKTELTNRIIKCFLAVASSGSIASWVVWSKYEFVWATIIASSHFIGAIKNYLPFDSRRKALKGLSNDLESISLSMETSWFDVSEGHLTEREIHAKHMTIKKQRRQLIQKHLHSDTLPFKEKLDREARIQTKEYFNNSYGME